LISDSEREMRKFRQIEKLSTIISALECGDERELAIALQFEQAWASFRPVASHFATLSTLQHHQIFKVKYGKSWWHHSSLQRGHCRSSRGIETLARSTCR
jgi:hypothetical protein